MMKNLLILPLVLLSFSVSADGQFILGTLGKTDFYSEFHSEDDRFARSLDSNFVRYGANFYSFIEDSYYLGASFVTLDGFVRRCSEIRYLSPELCQTVNTHRTSYGGEIGWNFEYYTPFIGANFHTGDLAIFSHTKTDEWSLDGGIWLTLDRFYLRGAMYSIEDGDSRSIAVGYLYHLDSDFVLGSAIELWLDRDIEGVSFTLSFGRTF